MEQSEVLGALARIGAARRGQISEQWYEAKGKDGKTRRTGPYYVWARCVDGRKRFVRIPREEAQEAKAQLDRGKVAAELIGQFWANAEAEAEAQKKRAGRTGRAPSARNSGRPSR
jgi:hypothetical protein